MTVQPKPAFLAPMIQPALLQLLLLPSLLTLLAGSGVRAQNCGPTGQCSSAWRTHQLNLETAWAAYTRPRVAPSISGADCSVYTGAMNADLAQFNDGGIRREDTQAAIRRGGVLYQVIAGQLYRNASACENLSSRCAGVEHYLLRVAPRLPRDAEFVVNVEDYPLATVGGRPMPLMSFSKSTTRRHRDILYPAWSFNQGGPCLHPIYSEGIGDWNGTRDQLLASAREHPWPNKTDVVFFRGSRTSAERDTVVLLSLAKPELFDARYTKNQAYKSAMDTLNLEPEPYISLPEHCRYRYLINMRGVAASFRLRHILLCGSLVMHVGSDWIEFFYPALRPWIHYVPVTESMRDAEDKLLFIKANQDWAARIATEGAHFVANHLQDSDVACYWQRLLRRLSRLFDYAVTLRDGMQLVE